MIDAQIPKIIDGWISQCVYVDATLDRISPVISAGFIAINVVSSSSVSICSTSPSLIKLSHSKPSSSFSLRMCDRLMHND